MGGISGKDGEANMLDLTYCTVLAGCSGWKGRNSRREESSACPSWTFTGSIRSPAISTCGGVVDLRRQSDR